MSNITTKNADDSKHQCAACGDSDDGGGSLKACTACNLVKYCNRTCQVAHWPAHKKACKKRHVKHHCCAACGDSDDGGGSLKACSACNLGRGMVICSIICIIGAVLLWKVRMLVLSCFEVCSAHRPAHKKACRKGLAKHHCCAACGDSNDGGGSLKACTGCNLPCEILQ